jgi:hypothetical protein
MTAYLQDIYSAYNTTLADIISAPNMHNMVLDLES